MEDVELITKPMHFFNGSIICATGFSKDERKMLKGMVESCGGIFTDEMDSSNITCLIAKSLMSEKSRHAKRWGVPVLSLQWIFDCISERKLVSFNNYVVNDL